MREGRMGRGHETWQCLTHPFTPVHKSSQALRNRRQCPQTPNQRDDPSELLNPHQQGLIPETPVLLAPGIISEPPQGNIRIFSFSSQRLFSRGSSLPVSDSFCLLMFSSLPRVNFQNIPGRSLLLMNFLFISFHLFLFPFVCVWREGVYRILFRSKKWFLVQK